MLSDLEKVRDELRSAMFAMDAVTSELRADRYQLSSTRLRLSQAGLKGCTAWGIIFDYLLHRVDPETAESLQSLQQDHLAILSQSSAHIGRWTLDQIEKDWPGYCTAYQTLRSAITTYINSEKRVLHPILKQEARG
jgi:hypothetical protein